MVCALKASMISYSIILTIIEFPDGCAITCEFLMFSEELIVLLVKCYIVLPMQPTLEIYILFPYMH